MNRDIHTRLGQVKTTKLTSSQLYPTIGQVDCVHDSSFTLSFSSASVASSQLRSDERTHQSWEPSKSASTAWRSGPKEWKWTSTLAWPSCKKKQLSSHQLRDTHVYMCGTFSWIPAHRVDDGGQQPGHRGDDSSSHVDLYVLEWVAKRFRVLVASLCQSYPVWHLIISTFSLTTRAVLVDWMSFFAPMVALLSNMVTASTTSNCSRPTPSCSLSRDPRSPPCRQCTLPELGHTSCGCSLSP